MKNLILFISALTLTSCSISNNRYIGKVTTDPKPDRVIIHSWGDNRFHDCSELQDDIYHVYGVDTVLVATYFRKTQHCK